MNAITQTQKQNPYNDFHNESQTAHIQYNTHNHSQFHTHHHQSHNHNQSQSSSHNKPQKYIQSITKIIIYISLILLILLVIVQYIQNKQVYTVAIIGTNDLHGKVFSTLLFRNDTKQQYKYGGLVYLAKMIEIIKQENKGNILYLDAGDQFQGGIQASKLISNGQIMNDYFNIVGLNGSSIGNHQFDFQPQFLWQFLKGRQIPNLAANLQSEKGQKQFMPFHKASQLYTLPNGIKIGVIGLSTLQTLYITAGFSTHRYPAYKFLPYKQVVIQQSNILKSQGAHAILIVSHIGDQCKSSINYAIRTQQSQQQQISQCPNDQITKLLQDLPYNTVHGIVQGHRHKTAHRYYRGVPYMGSINSGYYFNIMYLQFNSKRQLINSYMQGPIAVCQKIFQNTKRCDYVPSQQLYKVGKLVDWQFHNIKVSAHKQLQTVLQQKYGNKMKQYIQPLCISQLYLYRHQYQQSELSNLFTSLMRKTADNIDFALVNMGAFRTQWTPGIIQYQDLYGMFPFQNTIQTFQITGKHLIQLIILLQEKGRRLFQGAGLVITVQVNLQQSLFNRYKFINATLQNGKQIQMQKIYKGVTVSYLLDGGDSFNKAKANGIQFMNIKTIGDFRDTIKPLLIDMKVIRKVDVIDKDKPRLILKYVGSKGNKGNNKL